MRASIGLWLMVVAGLAGSAGCRIRAPYPSIVCDWCHKTFTVIPANARIVQQVPSRTLILVGDQRMVTTPEVRSKAFQDPTGHSFCSLRCYQEVHPLPVAVTPAATADGGGPSAVIAPAIMAEIQTRLASAQTGGGAGGTPPPSVLAETVVPSRTPPIKVVSYHYDAQSQHGRLAVDISATGLEGRDWVVQNIGKICSSKTILLEAGQEKRSGGRFRVLDESITDNVLTIDFSSGFDPN